MARLDGTVPRGKFAYIYIIVFIYFALVSPELMGSMSEPNKMARLKDVTNPDTWRWPTAIIFDPH